MEEDVCEEYKSSLLDLTCNSKPLINMLTMLAEENIDQAPRIVRSIEEHLQKVPIEMKLPVLYLIDSIMKNVGGAYRALFTQNVVSNFCSVFEKGDEKMRMQLFKLRQTWAEIFPNKKLYGLDTRVRSLDPAWPIMAKEPQQTTTIHVNPKFLEAKANAEKQQALEQQSAKTASLNPLSKPTEKVLSEVAPASEGEQVQRMLLQKQQEFILLQRQKLQLELQMQQQLKQKQEAEQLMKSLKSSSGGPVRGSLPPPIPGGTPMRPQVLQPQTPVAARDPRLQQRLVPPPEFSRPPPALPPTPQQPASEARTVASAPTPAAPQLEKTPNSSEKRGSVRGSAKEDVVSKSPPKKFRIPKTTDRKKSTEEGGKNGTTKASPTKTSPTKSRKASEDKDERHAHRSLTSSSASSPGRGGKKSRGKGSKSSSKGEENIRPAESNVEKNRNAANSHNNASPAAAEVSQTGDVDMRIIPEKKRDGDVGNNGESPQHKKHKGGEEAVLGDFDYRKGANSASRQGWAQYKAAHPDEYKSPLRPARENMDGRDEDLRQLPPGAAAGRGGASMGRGGFHGRGAGQPLVDRFGRPLFRRLMSDPRFRSHVGQGPGSDPSSLVQQQRLQMEWMLADPEAFLQQTEEQHRAGLLNPDLHRELKAELEKLSQFRKSQPHSPPWVGKAVPKDQDFHGMLHHHSRA
ncbi:unnamed protein product [Ixodes hexagonus]